MTISSMTGFGRGQAKLSDGLAAGVTVRSVNHRYLDVQVRLTVREELPELDAAVREEIARVVDRGRVSVQVNLQRLRPPESTVVVDRNGLREVLHQLQGVEGKENSGSAVRVGDLLSLPGLVTVCSQSSGLTTEEIQALRDLLSEVASTFVAMRREEGERLVRTIESDLGLVKDFVDWIEPQQDEFRAKVLLRLRQRIEELMDGVTVDDERMVHEAAMLADRSDVAEEVVRLRVHIESFERRLRKGGVIGRALDFLCQELHRELNTLGTKCREIGVADRVVDAKGAVEKIREQVQNIE